MVILVKKERPEVMRILFVVSRPLEINTSASIRNKATIEGLLELGHQVDLITTQYDTNHSNYDKSILDGNLKVKYINLGGVQGFAKIGRKHKRLQPIKNFLYKVISKFEMYDNLKGIVNYSSKLNIDDSMYDLIISSSDPKSSHLFVYKMYESEVLKDTTWIQVWGDPFLSDITRRNNLLNKFIKKEEHKLLKYPDKVVYVSNLTLKEQQKIYKNYAYKMYYEPIPYVKKEIYHFEEKNNEPLTFLYCGDYSSSIRNIRPLYDSIKKTHHKLIICGNSDIKLESTDRIKVFPRVSFEKTKEFERECDVLVHLSNLSGTQIPGKIYHYSGTNKPILFILDGDKEELLRAFTKYKRYIFTENNIEDIEKKISRISKGEYNNTSFVVDDFSPRKIAGAIIEEINNS